MRKIALVLLVAFLSGGCAHIYSPNFRSYKPTDCDPVLSVHIPQDVAQTYELTKAVREHPSLADKLFPTSGTLENITKNGASVGTGTAAIVSALSNTNVLGTAISAAALGGVQAVVGARSEDKTQDRVDVCMPKDAKKLYFKNEDQVLQIEKGCPQLPQ